MKQRNTPYWAPLQRFLIQISAVSPDGSWLYDGTSIQRPESPRIEFDDNVDIESNDSNDPDILSDKIKGIESGDLPTRRFRDTPRPLPFEEWIRAMALAIQKCRS
jgi:hypothetical protein